MTIAQFLIKLAALDEPFEIADGKIRTIRKIVGPDGLTCGCPISALAGRPACDFGLTARWLGISEVNMVKIVNAADNHRPHHGLELRNKILKACKLPEEVGR